MISNKFFFDVSEKIAKFRLGQFIFIFAFHSWNTESIKNKAIILESELFLQESTGSLLKNYKNLHCNRFEWFLTCLHWLWPAFFSWTCVAFISLYSFYSTDMYLVLRIIVILCYTIINIQFFRGSYRWHLPNQNIISKKLDTFWKCGSNSLHFEKNNIIRSNQRSATFLI